MLDWLILAASLPTGSSGLRQWPTDALGFDFEGARFSHVDDRVAFEVVLHGSGLARDPALRRLQAQHADGDAGLATAGPPFDTLHAALAVAPDERRTAPRAATGARDTTGRWSAAS